MRVSVSLPDEDVALLDAYARRQGLPSRSAAVRHAVRLLPHPSLEQDYAAAWQERDGSGEQGLWDGSSAGGPAVPGSPRGAAARLRGLARVVTGRSLPDELLAERRAGDVAS